MKTSKYSHVLLVWIAFAMPIYSNAVSWLSIMYVLINLYEVGFNKKKLHIHRTSTAVILCMLLYGIYAMSLIWSENIAAGLFDLQVKLSLFFFPSVFLIEKQIPYKSIIHAFILGCVVSSLVFTGIALLNFLQRGHLSLYTEYTQWFHPSYISLYYLTSIFFTFISDLSKTKVLLINFLLITNVLIIGSKAGILLLILSLFVYSIVRMSTHRYLLIFILIMLTTGTLLVLKNNTLTERFYYSFKSIKNYFENKEPEAESTGQRILIYKTSVQIIRKYWLIGVGCGDAKDILLNEYKNKKLYDIYKKQLNAHNQYIQTFISIGVTGFILLILILYFTLIKNNAIELKIILLLIASNFLFESMLEAQAGTIFFGYMMSLLNVDR